ncbi:small secreted protein [Streptomyces sp. ST2-7A]|uniref:small secreted protein n=1 Tax=Streptomyces sp. ST2-7A TaxID=2907214 RepID=UPI001F378472|nr:small secreted protein [Streptomyces sp. ST2-7A]MCE7080090.1 small secreted protein [Streptomyces sp. ST2-7A]
MNRKLAMAMAGCATLALVLTGCGDDTAERTEEWAAEFCDAAGPRLQQIQAANTSLAEASESDEEPEVVQEVYSESYGRLSDAYAGLAEAVEGAGDPPVDDGEQLREDATAELNALSESYDGLREASDELDTADRAAFAEGLREMVGQLEEFGQIGGDALTRLQSGQLGEAMAEQEGCRVPGSPVDGDADPDGAGTEGTEGGTADETEEADDAGADADGNEEEDAEESEG